MTNKRRPLWQLRLSSLMIVVILSSIPIALNTHRRIWSDDTLEYVWGWPLDAVCWVCRDGYVYEILWLGLFLNLFVALSLLTFAVFVLERNVEQKDDRMKKNKHLGGSFDDFLKEEGILKEVKTAARERVAKLRRARRQRALRKAKRALFEPQSS